jgi:hypothetical protein
VLGPAGMELAAGPRCSTPSKRNQGSPLGRGSSWQKQSNGLMSAADEASGSRHSPCRVHGLFLPVFPFFYSGDQARHLPHLDAIHPPGGAGKGAHGLRPVSFPPESICLR